MRFKSIKDYKPKAPSPASSMVWLAEDVKELTRLSQRVGHEVPGVVVWPLLLSEGWGGECSEILATIKLLYNPRVNIVFTFTVIGLAIMVSVIVIHQIFSLVCD